MSRIVESWPKELDLTLTRNHTHMKDLVDVAQDVCNFLDLFGEVEHCESISRHVVTLCPPSSASRSVRVHHGRHLSVIWPFPCFVTKILGWEGSFVGTFSCPDRAQAYIDAEVLYRGKRGIRRGCSRTKFLLDGAKLITSPTRCNSTVEHKPPICASRPPHPSPYMQHDSVSGVPPSLI
jgi:hypothetical protein